MVNWFNSQSKLVKFILLIIPEVGWIVELILRWCAFIENSSVKNLLVALIYTLTGWLWFLPLIDAILVLLDHKMLFID